MCGNVFCDLALGELAADAALAAGAVAAGAAAVVRGADAERTRGDLGRLGHRAHVHEQPHGQEAEAEHRPERDLARAWRPRRTADRASVAEVGRRRRPPCGRRVPTVAPPRRRRGRSGGRRGRGGRSPPDAAGSSPPSRARRAIARSLQQVFGDLRHTAATIDGRTECDRQTLANVSHLCTTCRTRETGVPDCTSSHDVRCDYGSCETASRAAESPPDRRREPSTARLARDRATRNDRKGNRQRDARHRHLEVARRQRRVPGVVHRRHPADAGRDPVSASAARSASRCRGARR